MLVAGFPSAVFATNVYVIAPAAGEECVIVDPGIDVVAGVEALLAEHRLKPVAVLLTHGHLDHTFSVVPLAGARDIPAWIHPGDEELLSDPLKGLRPETAEAFRGQLTWQEPSDVKVLHDGATLDLAGLRITVAHAPGHTPGSVIFQLPGVPDVSTDRRLTNTVLSGDVLFAGAIGRTDAPGGSMPAMMRSLRDVVLPLPDDVLVLPGHGPATTMADERATNPYLAQASTWSQDAGAMVSGTEA